jgi:hypothetical protein
MPPQPATAHAIPPGLDHLVVVAHTLADGVAWCERTLGVTPGPGGEHPLMGTHNRLLSVASPAFPAAYLEIIAINTVAESSTRTSGRRWFDMDFEPLMQRVARDGPQLAHWVVRVPDLAAALLPLNRAGLHPGDPVALSRATPQGLLQWHITLRPDGVRPLGGCLPTLIQWGNSHPSSQLPASGVTLDALTIGHPQAQVLSDALAALKAPAQVTLAPAPMLQARLRTPAGPVTLNLPVLDEPH